MFGVCDCRAGDARGKKQQGAFVALVVDAPFHTISVQVQPTTVAVLSGTTRVCKASLGEAAQQSPLSQWTHIAVTHDESAAVKLYVNSELLATGTATPKPGAQGSCTTTSLSLGQSNEVA